MTAMRLWNRALIGVIAYAKRYLGCESGYNSFNPHEWTSCAAASGIRSSKGQPIGTTLYWSLCNSCQMACSALTASRLGVIPVPNYGWALYGPRTGSLTAGNGAAANNGGAYLSFATAGHCATMSAYRVIFLTAGATTFSGCYKRPTVGRARRRNRSNDRASYSVRQGNTDHFTWAGSHFAIATIQRSITHCYTGSYTPRVAR